MKWLGSVALAVALAEDNFGIDLDTAAWGPAVHPMELVNTGKTQLVWRKK